MTSADRWLIRRLAGAVRVGRLTVRLPDGATVQAVGADPGPEAVLDVRDERFVRRLLGEGAIGLAEAWIDGEIETPDLASVIELAALHLEPGRRPPVPPTLQRAIQATWRAMAGPVSRGPLRTTVEHYDLGNDFFRPWLDRSMTYSSGVFADPATTLEEAQAEKYRRIALAAGLTEGMHVLEIGSGWGAFAAYAAGELGCKVTTTTVSKEQAAWVEDLVDARGLADLVEVRLEDFAVTPGTYDAIVSIEMIESIPRTRWPAYFDTLRARLVPGGRIALQVITVADRHWRSSDANPDFIRRYIFPGSQVPSPAIVRADTAAAGLRLVARRGFGASYARTLAEWRHRFEAAWPRIADLGFDERFGRMWRYYLAYCEGGFRAGRTDVSQLVLEHAEAPQPKLAPGSRT
jgi:cyclopropane-fatty-acyl-phospholipid synthase